MSSLQIDRLEMRTQRNHVRMYFRYFGVSHRASQLKEKEKESAIKEMFKMIADFFSLSLPGISFFRENEIKELFSDTKSHAGKCFVYTSVRV